MMMVAPNVAPTTAFDLPTSDWSTHYERIQCDGAAEERRLLGNADIDRRDGDGKANASVFIGSRRSSLVSLARYASLRVGRSLPELQDEVRLLRLPPAFAAVPQYRVHTPGDSCPSQNRTSGFPRHPAPRGVIQRASALRHGFRSMRIRDVGQPTYCRA